ncbi:hypothetical protein BDY17DRAFT_352637 [Neohortaea acidophila]|uniref:Uncharacterized protein n=1 Tax=Neohortaea acidophila TaxID=245834 RepID=A0A6A6PW99_9PEZI|nr:uncharacterized protein BDY17DRAFT_352637 [Neohortaea acidophila]KAF2484046.1 hypothetical protein BDY17DRAFT_352637 [Neohortaea acidophila]
MMAAPNPSVSVFHFTSRISTAKIKKYKLATEKGMVSGSLNRPTSTPTSNTSKSAQNETTTPSTMEPPAKRPKLKLSVRPPASASPDNITVARPKRDSSLRIRYSENMVIDAADVDAMDLDEGPKPSPAASSDLSSLPSAEKEPTPAKVPTPAPAKQVPTQTKPGGYGRDFMSYYVDAGDDEPEEKEELAKPSPPPPPPSKKPAPPKQAPVPHVPQATNGTTQFENHMGPPRVPRVRSVSSRLPLAQPTVHLIDSSKRTSSKGPFSVAQMVEKLKWLSSALMVFGGVPEAPQPPTEDVQVHSPSSRDDNGTPQQSSGEHGESKNIDDFLAMFDDDEEDEDDDEHVAASVNGDEAGKKPIDKNAKTLNYLLEQPGEPDEALMYGIQFIQNALLSWAQQRLTTQYAQHYDQQRQRAREAAQAQQAQRRGPGRPRRYDDGGDDGVLHNLPLNIQFDLARTPEGAAIAAFQEVRDSGCLQVNATLPAPLTRALSHLYMQIDSLINQGGHNQAPWQCMSYGAQIAAHQAQVEKWKENHARAQEEMARQHHLAQQQVMQQMGIPQHHHPREKTKEETLQQRAIALEHKRSMHHAALQPHLKKFLTNPMAMNSPTAATSANHAAAHNHHTTASPAVQTPASASPYTPHSLPTHSSPEDGRDSHLEKIKKYMPNYLPLSGQSMKFSFAPTSELALKAFGAQAFPSAHTGPNLPNRGPMSANPNYATSAHAHTPNGVARAPVVPSNGPGGGKDEVNGNGTASQRSHNNSLASASPAYPMPKSMDKSNGAHSPAGDDSDSGIIVHSDAMVIDG